MRRTWQAAAALALCGALAGPSPGSDPGPEDTLEKIQQDFFKTYNANRGNVPVSELEAICDRALDVALADEEHKAEGLMMVLQFGQRSNEEVIKELVAEAIELMIEAYLDEAQIVPLVMNLGNDQHPVAQGYLDQIGKETANEKVKAAVAYARLQPLISKEQYGGGCTDEEKKALLAGLEKAVKSLGNLQDQFGRSLKAMAEGALFEMTKLQIGCVAPEIEGVDLDGVPFKLSDYRGKVVMLDFWGHW